MSDDKRWGDKIVGLILLGSILIGVISFIGAVFAFLYQDVESAAIFLVASALSFGLLSVAVMGK